MEQPRKVQVVTLTGSTVFDTTSKQSFYRGRWLVQHNATREGFVSAKDFSDTKPVGLYGSAIGDKSQDYYLGKFEDFDDKGPGLHASWNWAAFFFTGFWALYRKMYGWFFAWWFIATVGVVFEKVPNSAIQLVVALITLASLLCFSAYANSLYHHKIKKRIAAAQKSNADVARVSRRLSAASGVNKWVPIVCGAVPVIGVVAAIALRAYQDYTKRQGSESMKPAATAPTSSLELKPFSGSLDGERKPDFSFTPDEDQRLLKDREIMKQQGIGGTQGLSDVAAWGESQLAARFLNGSNLQRAHNFALMWQQQIMSNSKLSPARALLSGYTILTNHYDNKKGICRPDMARSGGIEERPDGTLMVYPECFYPE
jgi:hypothetical protein